MLKGARAPQWTFSKTVGGTLVGWATTKCISRTSTIRTTTVALLAPTALLVIIMDSVWWHHNLWNRFLHLEQASNTQLEVNLPLQILMIQTSSTSSSSNGRISHRSKHKDQTNLAQQDKLLTIQNHLANSRFYNLQCLVLQTQPQLNYYLNNRGPNK